MKNHELETTERSDHGRAKLWQISSSETNCNHPPTDLLEVGSDGVNGYYECSRCGVILVAPDEVSLMAHDSSESTDVNPTNALDR